MKRYEEGFCHICGCYGKLSYEHIPPLKALNNGKAIIYTGNEALKRYKGEKSKYICRQQGMGKFSLCEDCNNKTGSWYAPQYSAVAIDVAREIHKIKQLSHGYVVEQSFHDFPALAFAKQILSMFCSLLPIKEVQRLGFDKLLLEKKNNKLDRSLYDLRIYLTPPNVGQLMIGPTVVMTMEETGIITRLISDLCAYPFGFILNLTPEYPVEYGLSILDLLEKDYGVGYDMKWALVYLERTSEDLPFPLVFKKLPE